MNMTVEMPSPVISTPPAEKSDRRVVASTSKTMVNFWIDVALLALFAALAASSAVVQYVFPPGTSAEGWRLWGLSYNAWSRIQFGLTSVLALGILVHVMMHWTWVCGVVVNKLLKRKDQWATMDDGIRTLYGVTTLIVVFIVIGVIVAAANLSLEPPATTLPIP